MNIVFFGNTKYSTIVARTLHDKFGLSAVVTIPDRPIGRARILTPNPVKTFANKNHIPVLTFNKLDSDAIKKITSTMKQSNNGAIDFLIVADYGLILPQALLTLPKYAALNVHHSLLPKYRGPSPAPTAILNEDEISGVTIIKMTEKVDAGPILAQQEYRLTPTETTESLLTKLNQLGGKLVIEVIQSLTHLEGVNQDDSQATYTSRFTKQDGYIDLDNPPDPKKLDRMIRAFYPWPGVWSKWTPSRHPESANRRTKDLKVVKFLPEGKIQMEGKKALLLKDFLNGYPNFPLKSITLDKK